MVFMATVSIKMDGETHQLLGSVKLDGQELYNGIGKPHGMSRNLNLFTFSQQVSFDRANINQSRKQPCPGSQDRSSALGELPGAKT
jgi:hypothetical protein